MYADHQILILSLSLTQPASVYVSLYLVAESTIPSLPARAVVSSVSNVPLSKFYTLNRSFGNKSFP